MAMSDCEYLLEAKLTNGAEDLDKCVVILLRDFVNIIFLENYLLLIWFLLLIYSS